MPIFLIRSYSDPKGYIEINYADGKLPRNNEVSYVPWAMAGDRVVYARPDQTQGWTEGRGLRKYDSHVSKHRRRMAESELGMFPLRNPMYTMGAVTMVSAAIKKYLIGQLFTDAPKVQKLVHETIGSYFFTNGGMGFGRLSTDNHKSMAARDVFSGIIDALGGGSLDQKLSIHDAIGRKILPVLGGPQLEVYKRWGKLLRGEWFEDKRRGRVPNPIKSAPTTMGGTAGVGNVRTVGTTDMARNRGVDGFIRDPNRARHKEGDAYYDDVDARNLLFGAGISGTTGTLLQSAFAFGNVSGDILKQYVFAIIGYLVGGGMHSYHESMAVATKAGVPYTPGLFLPSLPVVFTGSPECISWGAKYYDIVYLGALHWRYNSGVLPSHLNSNLTTFVPPPPSTTGRH